MHILTQASSPSLAMLHNKIKPARVCVYLTSTNNRDVHVNEQKLSQVSALMHKQQGIVALQGLQVTVCHLYGVKALKHTSQCMHLPHKHVLLKAEICEPKKGKSK